MASAGDPSSTSHSPRSARPSRGASSPWSHVLRGDPESAASAAAAATPSSSPPPAAPILSLEPSDRSLPVPPEHVASSSDTAPQSWMPPDTSEHGSNGNAAASASSSATVANRGKKPAWQRPSNGWIEVDPVMEASWPPLSLSTKASPKSSSSDTSKGSSDIPISAPTGPVISTPSPKRNSNNINVNSTPDLVPPARQKPNKRGSVSSSGTPANGTPLASAAAAQITPAKQTTQEPSPRDGPNKNSSNSNWEHGTGGGGFTPQQHGGNDHHRGYGGNRRAVGGASHHGSFGGRRDQERGNYEWNHRGFSSRDASVQQHQQRGVRPYPRPPPPVAPPPFIGPPPPVRPFVNPIGYPDIPPPVYYVAAPPPPETLRSLPFVAHPAAPPAMFFPPIDPQRSMLLKQINYYFSTENLCKDIFLRQNMDEQGWVPISLIAGFNRVKQLTNSKQYILDAVRLSDVVELQGEKIRKRNDWMNWVLTPSPNHFGTVSGVQSPATSDYDALVARLQTVGLEGASNHGSIGGSTHTEVVLSRSASGSLNNQLQVAGSHSGDGNGQVTGHINSDYFKPGRSLVRSDTL
ncbi:la-related protein 1C [Cocos nucifera]|uniref:La-related protein 1C n=1 Tax=Cocos nucifera TaxID=13894 RepID=A0A8K0IEB6_COCNU|nr:la-related protein 1C [Cocos nucifera]